ncbi:MAG TPA: hypothetical protein VF921_19760 [Vicinamibacterales bacterium]
MQKPDDTNREESQSQAQSDATPDAVAEGGDNSSPTARPTSDASGLSESDEAAGEQRKRIYKDSGSPLVSRID